MERNYVPTTLDQYLSESKTITLKRGYGEKKPVVVGSNAPIRNQILAYVAENQRVSKGDLKRFIAGLNEGSRNPNASAIMWLKRNSQFFVMESKAGNTFFKLSPVGIRLTSRFVAPMGSPVSLTEKKKEKKDDNFDFVDTKKGYPRKGLNDDLKEEEETCDDCKKPKAECECSESTNESISLNKRKALKKKIADLRAKHKDFDEETGDVKGHDKYKKEVAELEKQYKELQKHELDESEGEEARKIRIKAIIENIRAKRTAKPVNEAEKPAEEADELSFDDLDLDGEEGASKEEKPEGDDLDLENPGEEKEDGDVEKVEITEFIITVTNAEEAIKELEELGIPAEKVESEEEEEKEEETPEEETEEKDKKPGFPPKKETKKPEGEEDGLDLEEAEDPEADKEGMDDIGGDKPAGEEDPDLDPEPEEEEEAPAPEEKIKVSVDHWEALKGWLEGKGVDIEEMFGGEVEVEEEPEAGDGVEGEETDDLNLDDDSLDGGGEDDLNLDLDGSVEEGTEGPMDVIDQPAQSLGDRIADKIADKIIAKL